MKYICKPSKIQIYLNSNHKSISKIKSELGCDAIINGGLYDMKTWQPVCHLRVDGKQIVSDPYEYQGYGWERADINMMSSKDESRVANFICCVALAQDNKVVSPMIYDSDAIGGKRGRTAIGTRSDGQIVLFCSKDGSSESMTPEQLAVAMLSLGCKDAVMLDGGKSSQCIFPSGSVLSSRNVQNYIAIWTQQSDPSTKCPYTEPLFNVRMGSVGNGAKWVQWYLNQVTGSKLVVDGIFGAMSKNALVAFQLRVGLVPDGICGSATRRALKNAFSKK